MRSFVYRSDENGYFFVLWDLGRTALLRSSGRKYDVELAKFYDIEFIEESKNLYIVKDYKLMKQTQTDDLRLRKHINNEVQVTGTIKAKIYTKDEFDGKEISVLIHPVYGHFIDLFSCVDTSFIGDVSLDFMVCLSPRDETSTIFVVRNVNSFFPDNQAKANMINMAKEKPTPSQGVVVEDTDRQIRVWNTDDHCFTVVNPADLHEHERNVELLGKWVKYGLRLKSKTGTGPMKRINDVHKTRVVRSSVELLIEVEYKGEGDRGRPSFRHEDIGRIVDHHSMIESPTKCITYRAWIRESSFRYVSKWVISPYDQPYLSDPSNNSLLPSDRCNDLEPLDRLVAQAFKDSNVRLAIRNFNTQIFNQIDNHLLQ